MPLPVDYLEGTDIMNFQIQFEGGCSKHQTEMNYFSEMKWWIEGLGLPAEETTEDDL
jgi:hypothetical protein